MPATFNDRLTKDAVLSKVPAFAPGILRVIDLLSDENGSAVVLARAISSEPTLSAQVLRLANSALFGTQCEIDTVQKAVVSVGNGWIQHLALTLGVKNYVRSASQTDELKRCWRHMLATAVLSRELARAANLSPERVYAIGLLHDIGRLGLLSAFPAEYAQILKRAAGNSASLPRLESETFGVDQCELGRSMAVSWNLPAEFAAAVGNHHQKPVAGSLESETIIQLACRLADTLGFFFVAPTAPMPLSEIRSTLPVFAQGRFPSEERHLIEIVEEALVENELGGAEHFAPLPAAPPPAPEPAKVVSILQDTSETPGRFGGWVGIAVAAALLIALALIRWHR